MTAATRFGVRLREPEELRRVALTAGLVWLMFGVGNAMVQSTVREQLNFPVAHLWVGIASDVIGVGAMAYAYVASDRFLRQTWTPFVLVLFFASAVMTPVAMYLVGYPDSGIVAIAYPIIAILAFYVLARWLASVIVACVVIGHAALELISNSPWPAWTMVIFVAGALGAAGFLTGRLMDELEESRNAERLAVRDLAEVNANLETKVAEQVAEVERLGRLRRFLSAPVAEAVLESSDESRLAPHRREIAVLFCDLRGFTAFTKQVEPEEVMEVLDAYYAAAGAQINAFGATLGSFEGDGLMAYLNDPIPCGEPAKRVVEMGLAIASSIDALTPAWQRRGYDLSYGMGMAFGHATLGIVGYDGRSDYTALGTVVNLAARLCNAATARELLVDHRVFLQTEDAFGYTQREPVTLKGFAEPVPSYLVSEVIS